MLLIPIESYAHFQPGTPTITAYDNTTHASLFAVGRFQEWEDFEIDQVDSLSGECLKFAPCFGYLSLLGPRPLPNHSTGSDLAIVC